MTVQDAYFVRTGFKALSMVAAEIWRKAKTTSRGSVPNCSWYPGSHSGRIAFNLFEQGRFAASHIFFKGFIITSFR